MLSRKGFTIVELLIVIVVIAILAAITLVSYNGIQRRAVNTSTIQTVQEWVKLLSASYVINGTIMVDRAPEDYTICLGTTDQYPETDHLDEGQCYYKSHTSGQLMAKLDGIANLNMTTVETDYFRGMQYGFDNSEGDGAFIWYELSGEDQDCGLPAARMGTTASEGFTGCMIDVSAIAGGDPVGFSS